MQKNKPYLILVFFYLSILNGNVFSQNGQDELKIDSLSKLDYSILKQNFYGDDDKLSLLSSNAYLKKGKETNDTLKIIQGYRYLFFSYENLDAQITYLDNILEITKTKQFRRKHLSALFLKGLSYYNANKYEEALNYYIKVKNLNKENNFDEELDVNVDLKIGVLKHRLGNYKESLKAFLKAYNFYNSTGEYYYSNPVISSIVNAYFNLKEIDSALNYSNLLLEKIDSTNRKDLYPYYLLDRGAILLHKKEFNKSIDTLNKAIEHFKVIKDVPNTMFSNYYLGKNYYMKGDNLVFLRYFKKVDSLFLETGNIHPKLRESYVILINEYKKREDRDNELKYVNSLLKVDSLLTDNYKGLSKKLFHEYDTPKLLQEKQRIINLINNEKENSNLFLKSISFLLVILVLVLFYLYSENSNNKKRFKLLVEKTESINTNEKIVIEKTSESVDLKINPNIINDVLEKLETFENEISYIKKDITVNSLAKDFNTNSKYLSRIINHHKGKTFSNYINSLRISHAIEELKNDEELQRYTLQTIANKFGFNSAESFSSAFYKNTRIKPSYFLKQLRK